MVRRFLLVLAFLLVAAMLPAAELTDEELARRAMVIKPAAAELKWQQIPWVTDLTEGLKMARAEKRPIFLWVTGDDPAGTMLRVRGRTPCGSAVRRGGYSPGFDELRAGCRKPLQDTPGEGCRGRALPLRAASEGSVSGCLDRRTRR